MLHVVILLQQRPWEKKAAATELIVAPQPSAGKDWLAMDAPSAVQQRRETAMIRR
jgi:hypothetical protein